MYDKLRSPKWRVYSATDRHEITKSESSWMDGWVVGCSEASGDPIQNPKSKIQNPITSNLGY
jgi:hypothetical protein